MSDGFPDQFGGSSNKKYKNKRLQQFISDHKNTPLSTLDQNLNQELNDWMEGYDQVDDITILGIKI